MAGQNISHEGHRQRMRARVEQYGLESLAPHEALEYLLYITNARRDTNGIAHALLERFGSFAGVLEASEEELCRVPGVGPASARMLHLLPEVSRYYEHSRTSTEGALTTTERLAAYLKPRFAGAKQEKALLLSLDSRSRVKSVYWLKEGNSRMVSLEVKDVVATENIVRALGLVKIRLRDHIILAENDYFSMRESNRLPFYDFETGAMLRPYGRE